MSDFEAEIAAGLGRGSQQAWSELYQTYAQRLWREVARMMGGSAAEVADVVQEVFLAAARSAGGYDPRRGTLWNWLLGIARRQVALRYRRQTARLEAYRRWWLNLDGSAKQWLTGDCDAPHNVLESKELTNLIRASLLEISLPYQLLLTSRYLDGVSVARIAKQTNATDEAVRAKLMRARRSFRKAFLKLTQNGPNRSRK